MFLKLLSLLLITTISIIINYYIYYSTHTRSLRLSRFTLQPQKEDSMIALISIQNTPAVYA